MVYCTTFYDDDNYENDDDKKLELKLPGNYLAFSPSSKNGLEILNKTTCTAQQELVFIHMYETAEKSHHIQDFIQNRK